LTLRVLKDNYPSSPQPLTVKKLKSKLYQYLPLEKNLLVEAWDNAGGAPRWRGGFIRPVAQQYPVTSVFGKKRVYNNGEAAWSHKGTDFGAPQGEAVLAPNDGIVVLAETGLKAYGGVVVLSHGYDLAGSFLHLSKVLVSLGQTVKKGDTLGLVGSEGIATGPHLHWQMTLRGHAVDPLQWLQDLPLH
jgi:murein DD-endopeptidase MepM/ murein hydrolase activator NlpD